MITVSAAAIRAAIPRVPSQFRGSPQFVSDALSGIAGRPVVVKAETANPIGCFKGRGTWLAVAELAAHGVVGEERGLVVASAGNFGQGVAYAARAAGIPLVVFAAERASPPKLAAMRRLGADVRTVGKDFDAARHAAAEAAERAGWQLLVDGQDPWIAIGAGGVGAELVDGVASAALPALEAVFVPVGNGALIAGIGTLIKAESRSTRVIGVQAQGAPSMTLSWRARAPIPTERADTIADGIAARVPVPEALAIMLDVVDDMLLVSEEEIVAAQRELTEMLPFSVEPAGAAGWAAIRRDRSAAPIAFILTGGNVSPPAQMPMGS